jgi:uncharacterized membrane protein
VEIGSLEQVGRNFGWMTANLFLAWAPVLFALHLRGSERWARRAGIVLVVAAPTLLAARLMIRGGAVDAPARALLAVAGVAAFAALWSWRARRGDRWARALGYLGVIAFAPNAPYIMTDLFHHVQDVRLAGGTLVGNVVVSLQYGWFLVLGTASWIALTDIGRSWLSRHWSRVSRSSVLVVASGAFSFGIYLGRIERLHSWHPLRNPWRFLDEVSTALTSIEPLAFVLAWWIVLVTSAVVGLQLLDRARAGAGVGQLVHRSAWTLSGVLLASAPLVPVGYRVVGADVPSQSMLVAVSSVLLGSLVVALAWASHPRFERRFSLAAATALIVVPIVAVLISAAAMTQWYAQFRGLCEYGPASSFHGDGCA